MESNVNCRGWARRKAKREKWLNKKGQPDAAATQKKRVHIRPRKYERQKLRDAQRMEAMDRPVSSAQSTISSPLIVEVPCVNESLSRKKSRKRKKKSGKNQAKRARYQDVNESVTDIPVLGVEHQVFSTPLVSHYNSRPESAHQSKRNWQKYLQKQNKLHTQGSSRVEASPDSTQCHLNTSDVIVIDSDEEAVPSTLSNQEDLIRRHSTPVTRTSTPSARPVPLFPLKLQGGHLAVALIIARSPRLKREGVFIGLFLRDSVLCFQGCVQMRVLAGLVNVEGYIYKPSTHYHHLYSPIGHPTVSVSALNPDMQDADFERYLAPLRSQSFVHFHSHSESGCTRDGCVPVDLDRDDIAVLEIMTKSAWKDTIALVLFKSLCTNITSLLHHCTSPSVFSVEPQLIDGFQTLPPKSISTIPTCFRQLAWDVLAHNGMSLLVCGSQGTGKSTLCRYLINYLLNRYPSVCYLECDVGQPEFTVPEVLSLHIVSEPVTGPPYIHQRKAFKSYFYGDNSPRADPVYYLRILKTLYRHFTDVVRIRDPNIPLIVNTCGWTSGMGEGLLLDLIRSISPSHIIRLVGPSRHEVLPFTEDILANRPGLLTWPSDLNLHLHGRHHCPPSSDFTVNDLGYSAGPSVDIPEESFETMDVGRSETEMEVIEILDSDEGVAKMSMGNTSSLSNNSKSPGSSFSLTPVKSESLNVAAKLKGKNRRQKHRYYKHLLLNRAKEKRDKMKEVFRTKGWKSVLSHRVIYVHCTAHRKQSSSLRKLALVAYLSPLLEASVSVAMELNMPSPHNNMLCYAPPLKVPWNDVAVHILHGNVPRDQILYAMNGQFVALGLVASEEVIDPTPGSLKFLKSHAPVIEFIGLGLLRGIDIDKKLFYLTTPECSEQLERVNVLVLGNTEKLSSFAKDAVQDSRAPYHLKGYQPAEGGQFAWSTNR